MRDPTFDLVWQKVAELEGNQFHTSKRIPFTYRFQKTYVVVSSGNQSIPRTFFQKIFERVRQATVESSPALQGQSFILGILTDPRVHGIFP